MKRTLVVALLLLQNIMQVTEASRPLDPASELKQLREIVYEQGTVIVEVKTQMKYVEKQNAALKTMLAKQTKLSKLTENNLELLKKEISERPKTAFMVGLAATMGPLNDDANIVYSRVITNVGGAYNPVTGVFTAPVKGVYNIRFTSCSSKSGYNSGVYLYRNHAKLYTLFEYNNSGYFKYIPGGFTVQLEKGDIVYTRLPKGYVLYESSYSCNTFSGYILFAM